MTYLKLTVRDDWHTLYYAPPWATEGYADKKQGVPLSPGTWYSVQWPDGTESRLPLVAKSEEYSSSDHGREYSGTRERLFFATLAHGLPVMVPVEELAVQLPPSSFGRFTYCGPLWGIAHVWSTSDPPNYGITIGLAPDGRLVETALPEECPEGEAPTPNEIALARAMVAD